MQYPVYPGTAYIARSSQHQNKSPKSPWITNLNVKMVKPFSFTSLLPNPPSQAYYAPNTCIFDAFLSVM